MRFSIVALSLVAPAAFAHHSTLGVYDRENYVEIEGVVTSALWRNPHVYYTVAVTDGDGETVEWDVETGSVTSLRLRGVDQGLMQVGDRVRIAGESSTRGLPEMFARNLLLDSGQEVLLSANSDPRWPEGLSGNVLLPTVDEAAAAEARSTADGLFRVWATVLDDRASFPLYGAGVTALTESARELKAQWDPQSVTFGCQPRGMPYLMTNPYPMELAKQGNDILVLMELLDSQRVIHMGEPSSQPVARSLMGYSRGRWEGNTLVVETDRIDSPYFYGDGTPQSRDIQLVEHFELNETEDRLDYRLTVTDPATFTEPLSFARYWAWRPHVRREPFNCVE